MERLLLAAAVLASPIDASAMSYSYHYLNGSTIIDARGEIELNERDIYDAWAQSISVSYPVRGITLDSPGGSIEGAFIFAQDFIEHHGLSTNVDAGGECASACSILWASGVRRHVQPGGRVGTHQASFNGKGYDDPSLDGHTGSTLAVENIRMSLYLQSRGAPFRPDFDTPTWDTPPDQMHWLTPAEIAAWRNVPLANRPPFYPIH
jgi:hypothetical protein